MRSRAGIDLDRRMLRINWRSRLGDLSTSLAWNRWGITPDSAILASPACTVVAAVLVIPAAVAIS